MLVVLLPFLKKFWPYIVTLSLGVFGGCYIGFRFDSGAAATAKLALTTQQINEATAVANANAIAASDMAQADARANTVEAQLAMKNAEAGAWETTLTGEIAAQADLPGKDAPDAPVLSTALDEIAKGNP